MKTAIQETAQELITRKDYPEVIKAALQLIIDEQEALHQSDLQGVFGLGFDEYTNIVNKVAKKRTIGANAYLI